MTYLRINFKPQDDLHLNTCTRGHEVQIGQRSGGTWHEWQVVDPSARASRCNGVRRLQWQAMRNNFYVVKKKTTSKMWKKNFCVPTTMHFGTWAWLCSSTTSCHLSRHIFGPDSPWSPRLHVHQRRVLKRKLVRYSPVLLHKSRPCSVGCCHVIFHEQCYSSDSGFFIFSSTIVPL